MNSFPESLTNVFLDGEACPTSVIDLTSASVETVTDALRDGNMHSCVEPKTLSHSHFRVLVPAPDTLHGILVFSRGIPSCSPVHGITIYGVTGCKVTLQGHPLLQCCSVNKHIYIHSTKSLATLDGEIVDTEIAVKLEMRDELKVHDVKT